MLEIAAVQERVLAARESRLLAHQLRHQAPRIDAAHDERAHVAMQRRDEIAVVQRRADSGDDRFLPGAGVNAAEDLVLAMQPRDAFLERANQLHPVVELKFVLDSWCGLGGAACGIGFRHLMYSLVGRSSFLRRSSSMHLTLTRARERGKTLMSRRAQLFQ